MKKWIREHEPIDPAISLDKKIKLCRKLVIQNMEKSIQHKMFYMYLKDQNILDEVNQFHANNDSGMIRVTFNTPQQAMRFYQERNFVGFLIRRRFNIYFDLSASQYEIRRYFIKGITEQNIRSVFEKCRQYGLVRLNTLYGYKHMKDTCILSYLRTQSLSSKDFADLANQLQRINVKLDEYKDKQNNLSQILPVNSQSELKIKQIQNDQGKENDILSITIMTIHEQNSQNALRSAKQHIYQTQKWIQSQQDTIFVDKFIIPTINPDKNKVLLVRDLQFSQNKYALQKFDKLSAKLKELKLQTILYFNQPKSRSILIVSNPLNYVVKGNGGVLMIFSRTQVKEKLIKIAQFDYDEIDQFIFEEEKVRVSVYGGSQIDNFGKLIDEGSNQKDL